MSPLVGIRHEATSLLNTFFASLLSHLTVPCGRAALVPRDPQHIARVQGAARARAAGALCVTPSKGDPRS
eukprot:7390539-Prymnesium_polylepis.1